MKLVLVDVDSTVVVPVEVLPEAEPLPDGAGALTEAVSEATPDALPEAAPVAVADSAGRVR